MLVLELLTTQQHRLDKLLIHSHQSKTNLPIITKNVPSSFTNTNLHERLQELNCQELILAGFMTHMCVSSTARAAFELGYRCTVVAGATATRTLPAITAPGSGEAVVDADTLKASALAAIGDMFAVVDDTVDDLKKT